MLHHTTSDMARLDKSARISAVVTVLRAGEFANASQAAAYFKCSRTAITRRDKGYIMLRQKANSLYL